jgi:hypothetical protein
MSVLHREIADRRQQGEEVSRALYRKEIGDAARQRQERTAEADEAAARIESLLPGAVGAGVPVAELAELTGWSRPTIYRMASRSREQAELVAMARYLEDAVVQASSKVGHDAGSYELAQFLQIEQDEVHLRLGLVFPLLAAEYEALASPAAIVLIDLLPSIPHNEKVVLMPLFFQGQPLDSVAESAARPVGEVTVWAALGLLRLLPRIRTQLAQEDMEA